MKVNERLAFIQKNLKAPKGQFNAFGKYNYRSCEDILEAVKPLLGEATLTILDDLKLIGTRYYIMATAILSEEENEVSVCAFAREEETKKGMDASQITGAASSYARKYALNGLFLIDDTKDADTQNNSKKEEKQNPVEPKEEYPEFEKDTLPVGTELRTKVDGMIESAGIDKKEFKEWLAEKGKIGKRFGNPSLSTMSVINANNMIAAWDKTLASFKQWVDRKNT